MKRVIFIIMIMLLVLVGYGKEETKGKTAPKTKAPTTAKKSATATPKVPKANPEMGMFMGAQWGVSIDEFSNVFKYADKLGEPHTLKDEKFNFKFHALEEFQLGSLTLESIDLYFMFDKTSEKYLFDSAIIKITPEQFDELLVMFEKKYGKASDIKESDIQNRMGATFRQKIATWQDIVQQRAIIMMRYSDTISKGACYLSKIDKDADKKAEENVDKGAEQL